MMVQIRREAPEKGIFTKDKPETFTPAIVPNVPINGYAGFLRPGNDKKARELGDRCAKEVNENFIADFERSIEWCERNGEENPDLMVHVSTYILIDGMIYMTYYANNGTVHEDPRCQAARLAFCPMDNPKDMTIVELQKVGDPLDGYEICHLYDTILMHKGGDELYLMWTAAPKQGENEFNYYRFFCTFNIRTRTLGPVRPNRFRVGEIENDFSISGMQAALAANKIAHKRMWSDIGIMQKLSARVENGEIWYYSGAYSGNFNCLIKSRDLISWEYVSAPDFDNNSLWENAVYVLEDKCFYFVRQQECGQGFLTYYDLKEKTWAQPVLIADAQSRSDFILYRDQLLLIHAPIDRNGFGMVRINRSDIAQSEVVFVADMKSSLFYPYVSVYGDEAYISYTVNRQHIRLSRFDLRNYV